MNATCGSCGSKGYQGFVIFECSNPKCKFYVPPKATAPSSGKYVTDKWRDEALEFLNILNENNITNMNFGGTISSLLRFEDAVIAGGAVRDWKHGYEPKDIDIFCRYFNGLDLKQKLGIDFSLAPISNSGYRVPSSDFTVYNLEWKNIPFQIIYVSSPIDIHISKFDFGLNMIKMDKNGNIHETPEFQRDYFNQTLTFYPDRLDQESFRMLKIRHDKMKAKFPNHRLEIG